MTIALPATLIAALTLTPMQDGRILRTVGGFDIVQFSESCEISTRYEFAGRSAVTLFVVRNEHGYSFGITSWDWSNREGEDYALQFRFDDRWFEAEAVGIRNDNGKGIQIGISGDALTSFREARGVLVASGETVITNLSLSGSSAAVAALDQCWGPVNRRMAAERREIDRFTYIPRDPFSASEAGPSVAGPSRVRPPVITNPSWASQLRPTYPDRARERGLSGSADLNCTVNPNGSVSGCSIVSETPAGAGFGRAALAAARSARLSPQTVDGVASGGSVRFTVPFNLPTE